MWYKLDMNFNSNLHGPHMVTSRPHIDDHLWRNLKLSKHFKQICTHMNPQSTAGWATTVTFTSRRVNLIILPSDFLGVFLTNGIRVSKIEHDMIC